MKREMVRMGAECDTESSVGELKYEIREDRLGLPAPSPPWEVAYTFDLHF